MATVGEGRRPVPTPIGPVLRRRPAEDDLTAVLAVHGDPRTDAADGDVIGFAGIRTSEWDGRPVLDPYHRLVPDVWGRGVATALAREAVAWAGEHRPGASVPAMTTVENTASRRTALAAGPARRPALEQVGAVVFTTRAAG